MSEATKTRSLLRPLLRGLPGIAGGVALCVLIALLYVKHAMPVYESKAMIKLADPHQGEGSANLYKDFDVFASSNLIGTEVEMLKSKVILAKTLDSMEMQTTLFRVGRLVKRELYHDAPFKVIIKVKNREWYGHAFKMLVRSPETFLLTAPGMDNPVKGSFDKPLLLEGADILLLKNDSVLASDKEDSMLVGKFEWVTYDRDEAINQIIDRLDITSVDKDVPILRIIYKSHNAEKAADYVNILANTYVDDYVESKVRAANITVQFLDKELEEMSRKLSGSENDIEGFRTEHNIVNIPQETETDLRKIAQLKIQSANMQMNLAAIDTLNGYIQKGENNFLDLAPNFEAFTDLLSTEMIKKIKQLQSEREDLLTKYTENDDRVKVINQKLKDITSYLSESIKNTRQNYEIKNREIEKEIDQAGKVFVGLPTREKDMTILERRFGLNEKIYDYLHQKKTEAEIVRAATVSFHRIIAQGVVPEKPVSPNKIVILAVSAIMGLLISVSLIYTIHGAKAKVNDSSTIEKNSLTPLVAEVRKPKNDLFRSAHFNDIAIKLELCKAIGYPGILVYSSFDDKEGKSYNAAGIARAIVALGKKVLLVDVHGDIPGKQGWTFGKAGDSGESGVYATPVGNLYYYPANEETADGVVIREDMEYKAREWKRRYDAVVIRNQSISRSANALIYMSIADTNLFVLDSRRTAAKKIMEADLLKEKYTIPDMRFVLNRAFYSPSLVMEIGEKIKFIFRRRRNS